MNQLFPYRYRVMILLFFLTMITYLDRICISLVGVRIKSAFHLNNEQFGWVVGAFALSYALFEIPTGVMGDRIGQRRVLIRIVLWWSLFTAATGAVTSLLPLLITRFLFGMGESGAFPTGSAVISRWMPAGETSRGISCLMVGSSTGAAIAPLIVIPIAMAYGWRAPFFVNGLIGLIWVLICFAWFKNNPVEMKGISSNEKELIEKKRQFSDHLEPFPWKMALRNRSIWAMSGAFFCSQWGLYFFIAWMPVYLQEGRHFSENSMKLITSYLFVIGILVGMVSGFLIDRLVVKKGIKFSRQWVGFLALFLMGLLFFVAAITPGRSVAAACLIGAYMFIPINGINVFSSCVNLGKNKAGTITGIVNFAGSTGAFFLAIVFGKIADATHSFSAPMFVVAGVLIAGGILWFFVDVTRKIDAGSSKIDVAGLRLSAKYQ
jgi:ACS family glucarate transporter-like MFS transporter